MAYTSLKAFAVCNLPKQIGIVYHRGKKINGLDHCQFLTI